MIGIGRRRDRLGLAHEQSGDERDPDSNERYDENGEGEKEQESQSGHTSQHHQNTSAQGNLFGILKLN